MPSDTAPSIEGGGVPAPIRRALEQAGAWDPELLSEAAAALPRALPPYPDGALHEEDEEYVDGDDEQFEVGGEGRAEPGRGVPLYVGACWCRAAAWVELATGFGMERR